jgi:GNAT superfamily N-acetyltransferase
MEIEMSHAPDVPEIPPGITVRSFRVGEDERPVYEAECQAYAEDPRWRDEGFERWSDVFEGDDFDPGAWLVALEDDRVVAFCQNLGNPDMGWVQNLATIPDARGRGLGELLLRRSFRLYWDRGTSRVGLSVSSERSPSAWRLYERCGMTEVLRYTNYCKLLDRNEARSSSGDGIRLGRNGLCGRGLADQTRGEEGPWGSCRLLGEWRSSGAEQGDLHRAAAAVNNSDGSSMQAGQVPSALPVWT